MGTVTGANAPIPAESPPKGGAVLLSLLLPKERDCMPLAVYVRT